MTKTADCVLQWEGPSHGDAETPTDRTPESVA